ncbi:exosome complex exonuclease RRP40, putative [Entamoeba invadens IP1]|uniref:Exosome complex exonuclease RRP40, putative n=1 Tax=Entamoeba invadens IP1 TaxID=370355 RepID=A0A0A1TZH6_ENTIV|nr:exosome complex exonuclease RRP40, putative [Entamoeba invadens IP1]ELP87000.1 exosome complex exonuclease RRP40, putative [Entamoeba invadens IP1]|eukprot:XP_004253771.1 exosome complex exonuclease RRP40, putative [Entamoeba invadens IP1]
MSVRSGFSSVSVVFPGSTFKFEKGSRFGDGIISKEGMPVVSRAGVLKYQSDTKYYYVYSDIKKYHPSVGDVVVGLIRRRTKDFYYVNIGAYCDATLDLLAFENATKKTKPNLNEGDSVYCRVIDTKGVPQVACISQRKMEDGFGPLVGGWTFNLPQSMCRRIMGDGCCVLPSIGQYTPCEVAVGVNGVVWVRTPKQITDVIVENCLVACVGTVDQNVPGMVKLIFEKWRATD